MNEFIDKRDGNKYKVVKIGSLYWFTENLRYQGVKRYFPNRDSDNVQEYGLLYTWDDAMKACPDGWRLPTGGEFESLLKATKCKKGTSISKSLRSDGSNKLGFSMPLAGYFYDGCYRVFGSQGLFWSSTEVHSSNARLLYLSYSDADTYYYCNKTRGLSVRYVKEV